MPSDIRRIAPPILTVAATAASTGSALAFLLWSFSIGPLKLAPFGIAAAICGMTLSLAALRNPGSVAIPIAAFLVASVSLAAWLLDLTRLTGTA